MSEDAHRRYSPHPDMEMVECFEDINGEWVPNPVKRRI